MDHRKNFETLCRAFRHREVALLECPGTKPGEMIGILCAVNRPSTGLPEYVPLAQMLSESLDLLIAPCRMTDLGWSSGQN